MQVVGEKYFLGAGDPVETVADPFEFVDVRKDYAMVKRDFDIAVMNGVAGDELAVIFDFINEVIKVIFSLLKRAFSGLGFTADLKSEVLRVSLTDLIKHPVLDLENN